VNAEDAAAAFVEQRYPECLAAFVGGSVFRGEGTPTSDLDIVIITDRREAPYRESLREFGWPIEVFVHTERSYRRFFKNDVQRRRPSLPALCAEGVILRDRDGLGTRIREEAQSLLDGGPPPLAPQEVEWRRYSLTDLLDDFVGSRRKDEDLFIAHDLAVGAAELVLLHNRRWTGAGKWLLRALRRFDDKRGRQLDAALRSFYRTGDKGGLVRFVEDALGLVGGRLWEGYYAAAPRTEEE